MATPQLPDKQEQQENLFQTQCLINGKTFSIIVDSGSCANLCVVSMVNKVNSSSQPHSKLYKLSWLDVDSSV